MLKKSKRLLQKYSPTMPFPHNTMSYRNFLTPGTFVYWHMKIVAVLNLCLVPHYSNGKTDKRVLRKLAFDRIASEKEANVLRPSKKINVDVTAAVSAQAHAYKEQQIETLAGVLWQDLVAMPVAPPPVYRKDAEAASPTSTSSESGTLASQSRQAIEKLDSSSVEKGQTLGWEGYEDDPIPEKTQGHYIRNLRHQIFTLYRRLFGVVFVTNMAIFIATLVKGNYNAQHLGLIVVSNLCCAILMRQDYVINAFFNVFCAVPASWPLSIRRVCARVYHIGGRKSLIFFRFWGFLFTCQRSAFRMRNIWSRMACVFHRTSNFRDDARRKGKVHFHILYVHVLNETLLDINFDCGYYILDTCTSPRDCRIRIS